MVDAIKTPRSEHLLPYDPRDAAPLEVAISGADARILKAPTHLIRAVWSPDDCPAHLLPYLAAAWSVDHWNPAWPEDVKREVIRRAPEIHRLKGTRRALQRALDALGVKLVIKEWFEQVPQGQPYTFRLIAYPVRRLFGSGDALITPQLTRDIIETAKSVKPVSRWFDFQIGVGTLSRLGTAARMRAVNVATRSAVADVPKEFGARAGCAMRGRALAVATRAAAASPASGLGVRFAAAARMRAIQILRLNMEAAPA